VARANGLPLSLVLVFNISAGADMLVVRPDIKTLADMRGKRLGFEPGSVGELMLEEFLAAAGLTRQDIRLQPVSLEQQLAAWQSNQVDALITYEPMATQLLAQGAQRLFDSRQMPNAIIDVLAIQSDALDWRHAQAIRQLLQAHFRALDHLARNPQDAAYRMANHLGLPAPEVLTAFKGLLLPDASNNERMLGSDPPELLGSAQKLSALMVQTGLLKRPDSLDDLIAPDYLPRETRTLPP
jgi:NitT/TauT family transport system substrate-binding protein